MNNRNTTYCGPLGVNFKQLLGMESARNGVKSWFVGAAVYYLTMGRTAIGYIPTLLGLEKGSEVLAPAYNCGAELDPLVKKGIEVSLYRIDRSGFADITDIIRRIKHKTKAIYVTHYFGFPQKIRAIKKICEENHLYLIEDCALSLFSRDEEAKLGTVGDVSIFSITKTLPVPDGGVLIINNKDIKKELWKTYPPDKFKVLRGMLPLIKSMILKEISRKRYSYPLHAFLMMIDSERNISRLRSNHSISTRKPTMASDQYYNENLSNRHMSSITNYLLETFDIEDIIMKRRRNFSLLLSLITHGDIEPLFKELPEGVCPLNFPIIVRNRDQLQVELYKRNIYSGAWWKGYYEAIDWINYPEACCLKDNILTLPIHQGLAEQDIANIAENLNNSLRLP